MADIEAAIETKDSRTRALLKEREEKIIRVGLTFILYLCMKSVLINGDILRSTSGVTETNTVRSGEEDPRPRPRPKQRVPRPKPIPRLGFFGLETALI